MVYLRPANVREDLFLAIDFSERSVLKEEISQIWKAFSSRKLYSHNNILVLLLWYIQLEPLASVPQR